MISIPIKVRNAGGIADEHKVRLVDASEMYSGLHRALSYTIMSLAANKLEKRAEFDSSIQIFQQKAQPGSSIIHDIVIEISQHPEVFLAGAASGVVGNYITRFIDLCFRQVAGLLSDDEYEQRISEFERAEPFFEDLVETIETHIKDVHAPIRTNELVELGIGQESIIPFNKETKDYVSYANVSRNPEKAVGIVSRLSLTSGNGRFFSEKFGRTLSFSQHPDFRETRGSKQLSWSLRQKDRGLPGFVEVKLKKVLTNNDRVKKLILIGAKRANANAGDIEVEAA